MKVPVAGSRNGNPFFAFIPLYAAVMVLMIAGRQMNNTLLFFIGCALVFVAPGAFYFIRSGMMLVRKSFVVSSEKLNIIDHVYPFNKEKSYRILNIDGKKRIYSAVPIRDEKNELMMYNYCETFLDELNVHELGSALVLGAGGGTVPRFLAMKYPGATIDAIDISSAVVNAAREYFIPDNVRNINLYALDAFEYIKGYSKSTKYGFIFVDLFDGVKPVPFDRDSVLKLKKMLAPEGIAVFNLFTCYDFARKYVTVLEAAFERIYVFMYCNAYIVMAAGDESRTTEFIKRIKADTTDSDLKFAFEVIKEKRR